MRKLIVYIIFSVTVAGCAPTYQGFFTTDPYVRPYETQIDQPLTIILDESIANDFSMSRMNVANFRKSLQISLYYTMEGTVPSVVFADTIAPQGITLQLYRVRPEWEATNRRTNVIVVDGNGGSYGYTEYGSLIRFDGVVYNDAAKILAINEVVRSEISSDRKRDLPKVFRDGVREVCESIYQIVAQLNQDSSL